MNKPTLPSIEKRNTVASLRADSQGDEMALMGRAASFNVLSQDLGGFREIIAPGAFNRTLAAPDCDVKCLLNHDPSLILGRTKSGTLKVWTDDRGLNFRCQLDPNNQSHKDFYRSIQRGDIDECSFAFKIPDDGDDWGEQTDEKGQRFVKRTLRDVSLMDVSAVTYPAYNATGATAVSARQLEEDQHRANRVAALTEKLRQDRIAAAGESVAADKRAVAPTDASGNQDWLSARLQDALSKMSGGYQLLDFDDKECVAVALAKLDEDDAPDSCDTWDKAVSFAYKIDSGGHVDLSSSSPYNYDLTLKPAMKQRMNTAMSYAIAEAATRRQMRSAAGFHRA